jgi:hypothetical protein
VQIEAIYFPGYGTKIPNHNTQNTNNIKIPNSNDDGLAKSNKFVMPDLIRHPEHIEITGFPPSPE